MSVERVNGRRVILSVSGGKDSAAASLYLRELGIPHERVFADTGWEHPRTYEYLRGPLTEALGPIHEVRAEHLFTELVRQKRIFPDRTKHGRSTGSIDRCATAARASSDGTAATSGGVVDAIGSARHARIETQRSA